MSSSCDEDDGNDGSPSTQAIAIRKADSFTTWMRLISMFTLSSIITFMSFLCLHVMTLMMQWMYEDRRFYNMKDLWRSIIAHYKEKFYLGYLMIRNWDCHEDGKIKVIIPNYLAS